MILLLVYVIFGLYLLNVGFNFVSLSFIGEKISNWIIALGGALLIISGIMSMRRNSSVPYR